MLVLDTSVILGALNAGDPDHARCAALLDDVTEDLVVPGPVVVELDYWMRKLLNPTAWKVFVEDVTAGAYRLENLGAEDVGRAAELETTYADLRLGYVDASVIVVCERLGEDKVATLDRRHFSVVRPRHCDALRILPD